MSQLIINDLTVSNELDRAALQAVFGGIRNNEITVHDVSGNVAVGSDVTDATSAQHYFMWSPGRYPVSR